MKLKLVANLFILIALVSIIIGVCAKYGTGGIVLFPDIRPISFVIIANTFLLLALVLKLANE